MSKEEFEQSYAERSGVTVEWLHSKGQYALSCSCVDALCCGWQMSNVKTLRQNK